MNTENKMQQISIVLVVAVLFCLPAKTTLAASMTTRMASTRMSWRVNHTLSAVAAATPSATVQVTTTTLPKPTTALTSTGTITRLKPITVQVTTLAPAAQIPTATPTSPVTATKPIAPAPIVPTTAPTPTTDITTADEAYAKAITGTIIANRTEAKLRFFVEGATYDLDALRSIGVALPRATAVLNLYNCDANTPESKDCFWDPYLLDKNGFYEIINGADAGKTVSLSLRQAGTPPADRIWVQNRTGKRETVFYKDKVFELPPSSVQEFTAEPDAPTILLHLRNCLSIGDKNACEWSPRNVEPGYYYSLVEISAPGEAQNSTVRTLELQSIIAPAGKTPAATTSSSATSSTTSTTTTSAATTSTTPQPIVCHLQVPVINIRSGPGLQYQVIGKVMGSEQEPGSVVVIGRDETQQWLAVENKVAPGGWMTASPGFLQCSADIAALPIGKISDGRLEPTPEPVVAIAPSSDGGTGTANPADAQSAAPSADATTTVTVATPGPTAPSVGPGQALLSVNNGFDQPIRFTLDQVYRLESGPSEFDLQPGQGINILVHPGQIAFSASSAWHGLAGNAEFFLDDQKSRIMWITFVPDPDGSGKWILQF